ncbi:MAG TPA: hypothetical protein VEG60_17220 [Candidatus Binatia bacterium]|nr:hypothetical protein [Candidatus Binatia bacterium]
MTDSNSPEIANRNSMGNWHSLMPMSESRKRLPVEREFSREEYEQISLGVIPQGMDDRWFVFLEEDWLYFHRSWTGICIYQFRLEKRRDRYVIAEAWVNRDSDQYGRTDDDYDANLLRRLVDDYLLLKFKKISPPEEPATAPCPYCGQPLRTSSAKQCRFCGRDWHDPENVIRQESVHGLRRFLYWIPFTIGVAMTRIIGLVFLATSAMLAFDAFQKGRLAGQWLLCLGLFIGGIIISFVSELLVESFKRDGSGA